MRKHDPKHERSLAELIKLSAEDCVKHIKIADYRQDGYVASEVLASLVRARFGTNTGVLNAATEELNRRVISGVEMRSCKSKWQKLKNDNSKVVEDAVSYFWAIFLRNTQDVCNAEVRFYVYLSDRMDDFRDYLLTIENRRKSVDDMVILDEDGNFKNNFIDAVEDENGESPEEILIHFEESKKSINIMTALSTLPQNERYAYYFRIQCEYDWKTTADFLGCSIPTARSYMNRSLKMLQGVL